MRVGVGRYGIRERLCKYELGCCAIAVGWGYDRLMNIVPVCQRHKIEGREIRRANDGA